jgi:NAD(P)-dependent dehydrogenase (short-subunit alcohol dehydrogenase family)
MSTIDLRGRNVLVVGASSGIGRALACRSVEAGARTVLAARRREVLEEVVIEAGDGVVAVADIGRPEDAARLVADAVSAVGALDLVILAAGVGTLVPMSDADPETWTSIFATNVIGLTQVIRSAVASLTPSGIVAALSSETVGRARMGMGVYGASKAALDQTFLSWQVEHPDTRFCRVTLGATQPTGFGAEFDGDTLGSALENWVRHGELQRRFMPSDEVAGVVLGVLATALANPEVNIEHLRLRSPSATAGSLEEIEF